MRTFITGVFLAMGAVVATPANAAFVSSSMTGGNHSGRINASTTAVATAPGQSGNLFYRYQTYKSPVSPSADFIAVSVDPVTDVGRVDDLHFGPTTIPASSVGSSFFVDAQYQVLVTPANFPDPPVYQTVQIQGTYTETFTIDSLIVSAPQFASSTNAPILFRSFPFPHFVMSAKLAITAPLAITLTGTYTASGPAHSTTVPFTKTLNRESSQVQQGVFVMGNPGFGPGFGFSPFGPGLPYYTNSPQIFGGTVDNVYFQANLDSLFIRYYVPEPTGLIPAAMAMCIGSRRRRKVG